MSYKTDKLGAIMKKLVNNTGLTRIVYDLLEKLTSDRDKWLSAIKKFLREENPWAIWMILHRGQDTPDYIRELEENHFVFSIPAVRIRPDFP